MVPAMLNELYQLSITLQGANIVPQDWHKDLKQLPKATAKKPCYKILIGQNGLISDIEPMPDVSFLRKWEPSNGNSFPGFNIPPLYRLADATQKKIIKQWRENKKEINVNLLKNWCQENDSRNWDDKTTKKLAKCLGEIPNRLKSSCIEMLVHPEMATLSVLFDRLAKNGIADAFFEKLESHIWEAIKKGGSVLLPMLIHEGSPDKKPDDDSGSVSVFLDLPDWNEYPVAHEKTVGAINNCLLRFQQVPSAGGSVLSEDAYGHDASGTDDKLPEVKLPVLGGVKLRAMNSESPCQYRYGAIDAKSFLIGVESRKQAKRALEWLCHIDREGETWGKVDGKELLFAYPAVLPKIPIKLAACLGAGKASDVSARFSNYAKDVVANLKGLTPALKDVELHVFSLRKMDKARTKVVFHRNYSAQRLADAAKDWQQGCDNIPRISIKTWGENKGETVLVEPETPFPLRIAPCLNRVWKLDGSSECETKSVLKTAGIELLLDESVANRQLPHLLAITMQNGKGLLISLGNSLHRNEVLKLDGYNKHKQLMPTILGIFLWKLGIRKESYMTNPPYQIGRLLKFADELHALYCKEVRNGKLPPQLLGNALMAAALDSPNQALAQLALRISPYLGWAKTNSSESSGLSRYFLKEFAGIETTIRGETLPVRLDDAARAQLLLGYISANTQTDVTQSKSETKG